MRSHLRLGSWRRLRTMSKSSLRTHSRWRIRFSRQRLEVYLRRREKSHQESPASWCLITFNGCGSSSTSLGTRQRQARWWASIEYTGTSATVSSRRKRRKYPVSNQRNDVFFILVTTVFVVWNHLQKMLWASRKWLKNANGWLTIDRIASIVHRNEVEHHRMTMPMKKMKWSKHQPTVWHARPNDVSWLRNDLSTTINCATMTTTKKRDSMKISLSTVHGGDYQGKESSRHIDRRCYALCFLLVR